MLGLIYIFATAKPISMRRLSLLFVLVLISGTFVLRVLDVKDAPNEALLVATLLTVLAWSMPLLQIVHGVVCHRVLSFDALRRVSPLIQWTYCFVVTAVPMFAMLALLSSMYNLNLASNFSIVSYS